MHVGLHVVPATCVNTQKYRKKIHTQVSLAFNTCVFETLNVSFCCGQLMEERKISVTEDGEVFILHRCSSGFS